MTAQLQPIRRKRPAVVTIEREPLFDRGGSWLPVSRDIDPDHRDYIIRVLRKENIVDAVGLIIVWGVAAIVGAFALAFLIAVIALAFRI